MSVMACIYVNYFGWDSHGAQVQSKANHKHVLADRYHLEQPKFKNKNGTEPTEEAQIKHDMRE